MQPVAAVLYFVYKYRQTKNLRGNTIKSYCDFIIFLGETNWLDTPCPPE